MTQGTGAGSQPSAVVAPAFGDDWWRNGVIYQIYPRSFADSDGDGVGDLQGIIDRLDYLRDLGVDALWLSPIYPSPGLDVGYDVSDHTTVDELFGGDAAFDRPGGRGPPARSADHPRPGHEPHQRPPSVVPGEPLLEGQRVRRLVPVARRCRRRRERHTDPPEQLAVVVRRVGLAVGRASRAVLSCTPSSSSSPS